MRHRIPGTSRWIATALIVALLAVFAPALPGAHAQGTPDCPIRIVMEDMLILRSGPAWNTPTTTTLQAGHIVCLIGRNAATTWLQVGLPAPTPGVLGWAPVNAFWATVPFTTLPVTSGEPPTPPVPPVTPVPPPAQQTYVVQWGDTLFGIAQRFGVSVAALAQANNIAATSWVYAGQVLVIPGATPSPQPPPSYQTYVVQRGDFLVLIASRYGLHWRQLAQANNILPPYVIYPGQTLIIPTG